MGRDRTLLVKPIRSRKKSNVPSNHCSECRNQVRFVIPESLHYSEIVKFELFGWDEDADFNYPFESKKKKNKRDLSQVETSWAWICPTCTQNLCSSLIGRKMCIWWWDDKTYYPAEVAEYNDWSGCHRIMYEDKQWEFVYLGAEIVLFSTSLESQRMSEGNTTFSENAVKPIRKRGRGSSRNRDAGEEA